MISSVKDFDLRNCDCMDLMRQFPDKHFDLAIVDVGMPDMSGYELLAAMRQAGATVPAVALTGYASPSDLERAAQAG